MDLFGGAPVADADRLAWDGVICFGGPGRVVSSMKTKTHFAFRIDISDDTGNSIVGCGIGMRCGALPKIIARRYKGNHTLGSPRERIVSEREESAARPPSSRNAMCRGPYFIGSRSRMIAFSFDQSPRVRC